MAALQPPAAPLDPPFAAPPNPQHFTPDSPPAVSYQPPPSFAQPPSSPIPPPSSPPVAQQPPAPPQSQPYSQQGEWQAQSYAPQHPGYPAGQAAYAQSSQPAYGQAGQPAYSQAPHQQPQHPHWAPPSHKAPTPTWLLGLGFAAAILAIGSIVYFGMQYLGKTNPQEKAGLENPANPSKAKVSNPLQKYVEVVGIRLMGDSKKKPIARFIVVNHANTEIEGLAANVTLWASTSRSEEDSVASFSFKLPHLGPGESAERTEALKTKLKLYELPDWQNANADVQITAP